MKLFEPIKIGSIEIKNRIALAPMGLTGLATTEGGFNYRAVSFFVERAKGGAGLLITGLVRVENSIEKFVMPSSPCPLLNPAHFHQVSVELTERVHSYGTKIFLQLTMGFGRVAHPSVLKTHPVAPSPIPNYWEPEIICRELTIEEIQTIIKRFGETALLARESGFDGVEVHAVHEGYLLDQFAISMFNHRSDRYGGSLENRLRAATEIVREIKRVAGEDFPVSIRYSVKSYIKDWNKGGLPGEEFEERGRDLEEGIEVAALLEKAGYDALNVDAGSYDAWYWAHPPMYFENGNYLPFSEELKRKVDIPIIVAGKLNHPSLAERAIRDDKADMIALARGLLADPFWSSKVRKGMVKDIRPCIGCHVCLGRIARGKNLTCAVNPEAGREGDYGVAPAFTRKRVLVVGGGVAGMEAARVAALRGHEVFLYEGTDVLGGNLIPASVPDFKREDRALIDWYTRMLNRRDVEVRLNTVVDSSIVKAISPDVVFVATGAVPFVPSIDGVKTSSKVSISTDVLLGRVKVGRRVVIVGGGLVGCELAVWLGKQGRNVTILEMLSDILLVGEIQYPNRLMLLDMLDFYHVDVRRSAKVMQITDEGVVYVSGRKEFQVDADSIVFATGFKSNNRLYEELKNENFDVFVVGDALRASNVRHAIWTAYEVARSL